MLLLSILVFRLSLWQRRATSGSTTQLCVLALLVQVGKEQIQCLKRQRRKTERKDKTVSRFDSPLHSSCPNPSSPHRHIHTPRQGRETFIPPVATSASSWAHLFDDSLAQATGLLQLSSPAHHLKQTRLHKTRARDKTRLLLWARLQQRGLIFNEKATVWEKVTCNVTVWA